MLLEHLFNDYNIMHPTEFLAFKLQMVVCNTLLISETLIKITMHTHTHTQSNQRDPYFFYTTVSDHLNALVA